MSSKTKTPLPSESSEQESLMSVLPEDEIARSLSIMAFLHSKGVTRFPTTSIAGANLRYDLQMTGTGVKVIRTSDLEASIQNRGEFERLNEQLGYATGEHRQYAEMVRVNNQSREKALALAKSFEEQVANSEGAPTAGELNVAEMQERVFSLKQQAAHCEGVIKTYTDKMEPLEKRIKSLNESLEALEGKPMAPTTKVWEIDFADFPVLL